MAGFNFLFSRVDKKFMFVFAQSFLRAKNGFARQRSASVHDRTHIFSCLIPSKGGLMGCGMFLLSVLVRKPPCGSSRQPEAGALAVSISQVFPPPLN